MTDEQEYILEDAREYARNDLGMGDDEPNAATGYELAANYAETVHHYVAGATRSTEGTARIYDFFKGDK